MNQIKISALILFSIVMTACGGSGGSDPAAPAPTTPALSCSTLAGVYDNDMSPGDTLTINNDCTFTDSICDYDASYTVPTSLDNGTTIITVNNTNGCVGGMASIAHACVIEHNGSQLGINCDSGAHLFLFNVR